MSNPPVIMAIGAHHDDNECVAGTLARHKAAGWGVVSVVATDGRWSRDAAADANVPVRDAESRAAAALLGMTCEFLRFPEGDFQATPEARAAMVRVIRAHAPRVVLTHPPRDYHVDHVNVSRCALEAVGQCWNPCVAGDLPPCAAPRLYYTDAWFTPFEPDEYVDITETLELKLAMLRCHRSQLDAGGEREGDMIERARLQSRVRGVEAGVRYAEAFRLAPAIGAARLSPLLGGV